MIRRFYLENKKGHQFHFSLQNGCLLSQVSGLGFEQELTHLKYEMFFQRVSTTQRVHEIQATPTFLAGYDGYQRWIEYLNLGDRHLKFVYETTDRSFCYVDIKSLTKQELVAGALVSQITLNKLSLWLKQRTLVMELSPDLQGKVYPYTYPLQYQNVAFGKMRILNRGTYKAPLIIELIGALENPEVRILKTGAIQSTLRLYHSQTSGEVHVSSLPSSQYIRYVSSGLVESLYSSQDFTCENFLFLDPGESEIEYLPGVMEAALCRIIVFECYLGV